MNFTPPLPSTSELARASYVHRIQGLPISGHIAKLVLLGLALPTSPSPSSTLPLPHHTPTLDSTQKASSLPRRYLRCAPKTTFAGLHAAPHISSSTQTTPFCLSPSSLARSCLTLLCFCNSGSVCGDSHLDVYRVRPSYTPDIQSATSHLSATTPSTSS